MKTVIEIIGKKAVVMNENGTFERVKNNNYIPGQRINSSAKRNRKLRYAIAAASAALVLLLAGGGYAYCTPYSQVSIDVNPSLVLHLNYFNKVIKAEAMNADAQKILDNVNILNDDIQAATEKFVAEVAKEGYVTPGSDAAFVVTTNSQDQNRAQEMLRVTQKQIEQKMTQLHVRANVDGDCIGQELAARAREYGVSPGKLMLAERYALSTGAPDNVDIYSWTRKSVKEIVAATNENRFSNTHNSVNGQDGLKANSGGNSPNAITPGPTLSDEPAAPASTAASQNTYQHQNQSSTGKQSVMPKKSPTPSCTPVCSPANTSQRNPACTSTCNP
jgi:hypothetical protein